MRLKERTCAASDSTIPYGPRECNPRAAFSRPSVHAMSRGSDLLDAVRLLRSEGYYQSAIAAQFGISRGSVSDYLTGRYAPGDRIGERAFDFHRYEHAEEDSEYFKNGVEHRVMHLDRSFSPESDLAFWVKENPGARAYFIRWGNQGRLVRTSSERKPADALADMLQRKQGYGVKPDRAPQIMDGVDFVAVFY